MVTQPQGEHSHSGGGHSHRKGHTAMGRQSHVGTHSHRGMHSHEGDTQPWEDTQLWDDIATGGTATGGHSHAMRGQGGVMPNKSDTLKDPLQLLGELPG